MRMAKYLPHKPRNAAPALRLVLSLALLLSLSFDVARAGSSLQVRHITYASDSGSSSPIRIGTILPSENELGSIGALCRASLTALVARVVKEWGSSLTVGSDTYPLEIVEFILPTDTNAWPAALAIAADEWGVKYLIGPCSNGARLAELVTNRGDMLLLVPVDGRLTIYQGRPNVFGYADASDRAFKQALSLLAVEPGKTAASLTLETPGVGEESLYAQCEGFAASYVEAGGSASDVSSVFVTDTQRTEAIKQSKEKTENRVVSENTAFYGLISDLKSAAVDFLAVCLPATLCGEFLLEVSEQALNVEMLMLPTTCITATVAASRFLYTAEDHILYSDNATDIIDGADLRIAPNVWLAATSLLKVLESTGNSLSAVRTGLAAIEFTHPFGNLTFDSNQQSADERKVYQYQPPDTEYPTLLSDDGVVIMQKMPAWKLRACYSVDYVWSGTVLKYAVGLVTTDGELSCEDCALSGLGTSEYDASTLSRKCEQCPSGTNARTSGVFSACTTCSAGTIPVFSACQACAVGTESGVYSTCQDCGKGAYAGQTGMSACKSCEPGTYQNETGTSACIPCLAGYRAATSGLSQCSPCQVGLFSQSGAASCTLCPAGTVANTTAKSYCYICPPGTYAYRDATACLDCPAGTSQAQWGSTSCTHGGAGLSITSETGLVYLNNLDGFWYDAATQSALFCSLSTGCRSNHLCDKGTTGRGCMTCLPGDGDVAGHVRMDGDCTQCIPKAVNGFVLIILFCLVVVVCMVITRTAMLAMSRRGACQVVIFKQTIFLVLAMRCLGTIMNEQLVNLGHNADVLGTTTFKIMRSLCGLIMWSDGVLPTETLIWSVACLIQPTISKESRDTLQSMRHYEIDDEAFKQPREELLDAQIYLETGYMIFWIVLPIVFGICLQLLGYFLLQREILSKRKLYKETLEFSRQVLKDGFKRAKTLYTADQWHEYVNLYNVKVMQLWTPAFHSATFFSRTWLPTCNLHQFFYESQPIYLLTYFVMSTHVGRNLLRYRECSTEEGTTVSVHLYASEVLCGDTTHSGVFWMSLIVGLSWLILPPIYMFLRLRHMNRMGYDPNSLRIFGVLLDGYRPTRWWWEIVCFGKKIILIWIPMFNLSYSTKLDFLLLAVLMFVVLHLRFDPYENRRDGLLNRVEWYSFIVLFASILPVRFAGTVSNYQTMVVVVITTTVIYLVLFVTLVALICRGIVRSLIIWLGAMQAKEGDIGALRSWLRDYEENEKEDAPYVTFDHTYGWINIFGSGGQEALAPYIPRGKDAKGFAVKLSSCSIDPPKIDISPADHLVRMNLHRSIMRALQFVAGAEGRKGHMNVGLLEFVVRAGFFLHHIGQPLWQQAKVEQAEAPHAQVIAQAWRHHDPLKLQLKVDGTLPTEEHDEYTENANNMEFDLMTNTYLLIQEQENSWNICSWFVRYLNLKRFSPSNFVDSVTQVIGGGDDMSEASGSSDGSIIDDVQPQQMGPMASMESVEAVTSEVRAQRKNQFESERFKTMVHRMFKPAIFRQGILVTDMQKALLELMHMPPDDLRKWLATFLLAWRRQRVALHRQMMTQAGVVVSSSTDTNDLHAGLDEDKKELTATLISIGTLEDRRKTLQEKMDKHHDKVTLEDEQRLASIKQELVELRHRKSELEAEQQLEEPQMDSSPDDDEVFGPPTDTQLEPTSDDPGGINRFQEPKESQSEHNEGTDVLGDQTEQAMSDNNQASETPARFELHS